MPYLSNVAIRQDRYELITSISGHDIRSTGGSLQAFPKASQYVVSGSDRMEFLYQGE
jgi:hypothetical protein